MNKKCFKKAIKTLAIGSTSLALLYGQILCNYVSVNATSEDDIKIQSCVSTLEKLDGNVAKIADDLESSRYSQFLLNAKSYLGNSESHANEEGWKENWQEYDHIRYLEYEKLLIAKFDFGEKFATTCQFQGLLDINYSDTYKTQIWSADGFNDANWKDKLTVESFKIQLIKNGDILAERDIPVKIVIDKNPERDAYMEEFFTDAKKIKNQLVVLDAPAIKLHTSRPFTASQQSPLVVPELKELFSKYNDVDYRSQAAAEGEYYFGFGWFDIYKDGIWYGNLDKQISVYPVLIIPESLSEEKYIDFVKDKYSEFFSTELTPVGDPEPMPSNGSDWQLIAPYSIEAIRDALTIESAKAVSNGFLIHYKVSNSSEVKELEIGLVSVPDSKYTDNSYSVISSIDYATGVSISTNDRNVAPDAMLIVDNKEGDPKAKKQVKTGEKLLAAFDFSLYSKMLNKLIRTFDSGVEISVPIDDNYNQDVVLARYIADDGTTPEEDIVGAIEIKDGKKYGKFTLKHFSMYAILGVTNMADTNTGTNTGQLVTTEYPKNNETGTPNTGVFSTEDLNSAIATIIDGIFITIAGALGIIVFKAKRTHRS